MSKKEVKKIPGRRALRSSDISSPINFDHVYHIDLKDDSSSNVPPSWRSRVVRDLVRSRSDASTRSKNHEQNNDNDYYSEENNERKTSVGALREHSHSTATSPTMMSQLSDLLGPKTYDLLVVGDPAKKIKYAVIWMKWGSYMCVSGVCDERKEALAVRRINLLDNEYWKRVKDEIEFHVNLKHDNIVEFMRGYLWNDEVYLVFIDDEYRTLYDLLRQCRKARDGPRKLETDKVAYIALSILKGLCFVHSKGYIHRKLGSPCVLVSHPGEVRITDFSSCCMTNEKNCLVSEPLEITHWSAPEVATDTNHTNKADIWSFGILVVELVDGVVPFVNETASCAVSNIASSLPFSPEELASHGPLLKPFLDCCLVKKYVDRASASQLSIHPFLSKHSDASTLSKLLSEIS